MSIDRSTLKAKARPASGKGGARKLRATGLIPAVVYGRHLKEPVQIAVNPVDVKTAISTPHKLNTLITLQVDGAGDRQVLLKEYQQDPVSRDLLHADFIEVRETEAVKVNVPVVLMGKPEGVAAGGILSQNRRDLEVWALPNAIPEKIEVDVSHLKIAQALHINEVKFPAGVKVKTQVNFTIAVVTAPEKEEVVAPTPAAVPGAAAGAAGAAPAEGEKGAAPAAGGEKGAAPAAAGKAAGGKPEAGKKEEKKK